MKAARSFLAGAIGISSVPGIAFAHSGSAIQPHDLRTAWTFEPVVIAMLFLTLFAFMRGMHNQWKSLRRGPDSWKLRAAFFLSGWATLVISLVSPLHALGGALFSAHMTQHELLMTVAAPLLVLSRPYPLFLWALSEGTRARVGRTLHERISIPFGVLASPMVAFALHATAIWAWHVPSLYGATLSSESMHTLQHISFMGTAVLFWWSILPIRSERYAQSMFYLFATGVHTSALGALLTFSSTSWYSAYGASAVPWGLSPLDDQQLGGMIMWIPGGLAYLAAALWIAAKMLSVSESRAVRTGLAALLVMFVVGCKAQHDANETLITSADPAHGKALIKKYGCQSCHIIPGIRGATGQVGPSLDGIANRVYIAGVLTNSPQAMTAWLQDPQKVDSLTAMPNVGVTAGDARDIAAYLYTLR